MEEPDHRTGRRAERTQYRPEPAATVTGVVDIQRRGLMGVLLAAPMPSTRANAVQSRAWVAGG